MTTAAIVRQITISKYRGIESLKWNPSPGLNVILGGGDVGKTTVLEAIALLLTPSNTISLSEADYWQRRYDEEFSIEAVMRLPETCEISQQQSFAWPWQWNGKDPVVPGPAEEGADDVPAPSNPVYKLRVRGLTSLEPVWEIVQPNDEVISLSTGLRRKIGVVRLTGDDRNDRDLRLVYGSALDRLLSDAGLRARISQKISEIDLDERLSPEGKKALEVLDKELKDAVLPHGVKLGLTSSQGLSIGALIGILANKDGIQLPLTSWGAGTRRMAALEIASATEKESSIALIDEIERGLEPYRLRRLIATLEKAAGQSFVTTHSPVAIKYASAGHLWYLDMTSRMGALPFDKIQRQQERDPLTFLARVAVVAEGPTELGFFSFFLTKAFREDPMDYGIRVCNGQGNEAVLGLLEALTDTGLKFAAIADNEGKEPGRWQALKVKLGDRLFQWEKGCVEEQVIGEFPDSDLDLLLRDETGKYDGARLRTLATRLGIEDKGIDTIEAACTAQGVTLRTVIIAAATGNKSGPPVGREKEWKSHERSWFKSEAGGRELAAKMVKVGLWPKVQPKLLPLINAIRRAVNEPPIDKLDA